MEQGDSRNAQNVELKVTADGSHTLYVPALDEHYHSVFGAIGESMHIFIGAGLSSLPKEKKTVSIFEAGFGTGLNAFLTCLYAAQHGLSIGIQPLKNTRYQMRWHLLSIFRMR